ncbi:hypothetical protein [Agromyces archimandritae]|uniref:Uncharacterized protein n=1 Tax=Agromyces archimandritae TaxID=2781962 RepID=A0A975FLJ9_9MICO|nr:hypothetical protein [Agromyces archimandritae]QTX04121.1 hypothetical protein G127AT_12580 [Agromyces archimandritae]
MPNLLATGRPSAVIVDSTETTHVVYCSACRASWIYLDAVLAEERATSHRLIERERALPRCSVDGCSEYGVARGLCRPHYDRQRYQARKAAS